MSKFIREGDTRYYREGRGKRKGEREEEGEVKGAVS
jgi:hypothetical protein